MSSKSKSLKEEKSEKKESSQDIQWGDPEAESPQNESLGKSQKETSKKEEKSENGKGENKVNIVTKDQDDTSKFDRESKDKESSKDLKAQKSQEESSRKLADESKEGNENIDTPQNYYPRRPKPPQPEQEHEIVPSKGSNLQPLLREKEEKAKLNSEPEKSKIVEVSEKQESAPEENKEVTHQIPQDYKENEKFGEETKSEKKPKRQKSSKGRPRTRATQGRAQKKSLVTKFEESLRKGWNERFYLTDGTFQSNDPISKIYQKSHKSTRGFSAKGRSDYFPKIRHMKDVRVRKKKRVSSSLVRQKGDLVYKVHQEDGWNNRFSITNSKNNQKVYTDYKEFFDKPIDYDVRGYNFTIRPKAYMVYEDAKGNPDIRSSNFDKKKKKQIAKRLSTERSKTSRGNSGINAIQNWKTMRHNANALTNLRDYAPSQKELKKTKKKEKKWNARFAVPISTYNEAVFKKYRVSFEEI